MHIMRELDSMVELRHSGPGALDDSAGSHSTDLLLDDLSFAATATATAAAADADAAGPVATPGDVAPTGPDVLVLEDSAVAWLQSRTSRWCFSMSRWDRRAAWMGSTCARC